MSLMLEAMCLLLTVQVPQATLAGTVTGVETGDPLIGAIVALPDLERAVLTDARGRYLLNEVPAGPQHIRISFIGHSQRAVHALVPSSGRLEINLSLRAEPLHLQTIEVRHEPPIPGLEEEHSPGSDDKSISMAAVRNHPLLSEPDVLKALEGGAAVLQQESPSGVHLRGGSTDQTGYLLDGVPIFAPYHAAGMFSALNPDALSRVSLSSSLPLPDHTNVLSGTISATSRVPGPRTGIQGSVSTSQVRATVDGQLGGGVGYMLSVRSRAPNLPFGEKDPSYISAESDDLLAKLERGGPAGQIRLLVYRSGNEIESSASVEAATPRNGFEWGSQSFGAEWTGKVPGGRVRLLGWSANSDASADWRGVTGIEHLTSTRRDLGLLATVQFNGGLGRTMAGLRFERSRTFYAVGGDAGAPAWSLRGRTPTASIFGQYSRRMIPTVDLTVGGTLAFGNNRARLGPTLRLQWTPTERFGVSASYARLHQFAQSLRNPESTVRNIFPADLYIGSGAPGVPVARGDQAVLSGEYQPSASVRLTAEVYTRAAHGLLLVAPEASGPFSSGVISVGSGSAQGISTEASARTRHLGLVAAYGVQRVRFANGSSAYVPAHGTTHMFHGGVIVFPNATTSLRVAATGAIGRKTTTSSGILEWEACNLLDRGCEFAGSPTYGADPLGAATLPHYLRVDLGVRKHWHFGVAGRDAMVALFATLTNVVNRKNILTYTRETHESPQLPIGMVPRAPLVVGLDWQF